MSSVTKARVEPRVEGTPEPPPPQASEITALSGDAERAGRRRRSVVLVFGAVLMAVVLAGAMAYRGRRARDAPSRYSFAEVTVGDIVERVRASGAAEPRAKIGVRAQVSGRVSKIYVDFNSHVREGEVLAEIDPALARADVSQERANLRVQMARVAARSQDVRQARTEHERLQRLLAKNAATPHEVDQAKSELEHAEAELGALRASIVASQAQIARAELNVQYSKILAPVDGILLERAVDVGTVVSVGVEAPPLFVIASDLRQMRVIANIDEADVDRLQEGLAAEVSVDALPDKTLRGVVEQIRLGARTVQGVVTYPAVIDVPNPDLALRPGMSATVVVESARARNVRRVPNSALRYRPAGSDPSERPAPGRARVYVLQGAPPAERAEARDIAVGLTDGRYSELRGAELAPGTRVVTGDVASEPQPGLF